MRNVVFVLAAVTVTVTGGCNWTEFDNLADETWVNATEKPDVKSSDYGVGIQRGAQGADAAVGGRLVVLGTGTPTYSELVYDANGASSFPPTAVALPIEVQGIPQQPILLANPSKNEIALVVRSTNGVLVAYGDKGIPGQYQLFNAQADPDAGTYMLAPTLPAPVQQPLVAVKNVVFGVTLPTAPPTQPQCTLVDGATPGTMLQINALGVVRNAGGTDDVLAWADNGKLYKYPSSVFTCTTMQTQLADTGTSLTFRPEKGAQILTIQAANPPTTQGFVVLQGHNGDSGFLQVVNASTMAVVGTPVMVDKLRTAAILTVGAKSYVVAGAPAALVAGKSCGQVVLYEVSSAGLVATAAATFHDAQPEDNQSFGRSVTILPYNGKQVIAIAADNEIFVYFRANLVGGSVLYEDARQGR